MFPSVEGNKWWEQLWRRHGDVSLDPVISRRRGPRYWNEVALCRMAAEEVELAEAGIRVRNFRFHQQNCDETREPLLASSSCAYIQAKLLVRCLLGKQRLQDWEEQQWQNFLRQCVG